MGLIKSLLTQDASSKIASSCRLFVLTKLPKSVSLRPPLSLTENDFYPLIHICTKDMTYEEKVAYRAKHGIPSTVDKWILEGKMHTEAPTADLHKRGPSLKHLSWRDDVECILHIIYKKVNIEFSPHRLVESHHFSGIRHSGPQQIHTDTPCSRPSDQWFLDVLLAQSYCGY